MLHPLPLAADRLDYPVTHPCWNAVIPAHFGMLMVDSYPPVALRILFETAMAIMLVRSFEMDQILSTHPGMAQNENGIPVDW